MDKELKKCEIGGVILAGGKASRLDGIVKGTIGISKHVTIVEQLITELKKAGINNIVINTNNPKPYLDYGFEVIPDIRAGFGPIGGIETGLMHFTGQSDAVLFVPCDMPTITAKQMLTLIGTFNKKESPVVFAQTTGFFWHPLCAVVHNGLRKQISSAIDSGQLKVRSLWEQVKAASVLFDDENAFLNINTFEEMDKLENGRKNEKAN